MARDVEPWLSATNPIPQASRSRMVAKTANLHDEKGFPAPRRAPSTSTRWKRRRCRPGRAGRVYISLNPRKTNEIKL